MSLPWSSKGLKATPVNADELMIIDSADANPSTQNKRITIGSIASGEVFTWTADHDAAGFDLLNVGGITINNPLDSFQYVVTPAAITADRILNLPLITGTDTLIAQTLVQTLSNKTFNSTNEFEDNGLIIQNPTNTFNYIFQSALLASNRTITLPLLLSDDTMVTEAFAQSLTNKTLDDFSNDVHANILHLQVRNESGFALTQGDVVYISGFSIPEDLPLVELADASSSTTMPAVGIVTTGIADNANGDITASGQLTGPITTGLTPNAILYVSEIAGEFTDIKPTGTALIQNIGSVLKVGGAGVGVINVVSLARSNDLPNIPSAQFWVGNASGVPTAVTMSGDATMDNAGAVSLVSGTEVFTWTADHSMATFKLTSTAANDVILNAPTGQGVSLEVNSIDEYLFNATQADFLSNNIVGVTNFTLTGIINFPDNVSQTFNPGAAAAGLNVGSVTTDPSTPVNGDIWYESTLNTLSARINGVTVDLGAGGGSQTPWTSDIDADGFDLVDLSNIEFRNTTGTPAGSITAIYRSGAVLNLNADAGDAVSIRAGGTAFANFGNGTIPSLQMAAASIQQEIGTAVASIGSMSLIRDGNYYHVTGTTTITNITTTGWQSGSIIQLNFDGVLTVTDAATGSGEIILADSTNYVTAVGDVLTLVLDGTQWIEVSRSAVPAAAEVFTWTADHSAAGFDLTNLGVLDFASPADAGTQISADATGIKLDAFGAADTVQIRIGAGSTVEYEFKNNTLDMAGNGITNPGNFLDSANNELLTWEEVASAVNYLTIKNTATGNDVIFKVGTNSDLDGGIKFEAKNDGGFEFGNESAQEILVLVQNVTNSTDYIQITNSAGVTTGPIIEVIGASTDVDLNIQTKGAGTINLIDNIVLSDAVDIALNATTGTQIGTATTQKLAFYGNTPVVQGAALTAQDTTITFVAPGTPDFAIQTMTSTTPFGFVTQDEGNTVMQVIANLQTRLAEVEARLDSTTGVGLVAG